MKPLIRYNLPRHPLLGRNVNHDPRSRAYPIPARLVAWELREVDWERSSGILDQGGVGACTGCAGNANIYSAPFHSARAMHSALVAGIRNTGWPVYTPDTDGAYRLYSAATQVDPWEGTWTYPPPSGEDTGSDGLSIAKVLKDAGIISGYYWAFSIDQAVAALMASPVITGVPWFHSMFDADARGNVTVDTRSGLAGGHEVCVLRYYPAIGASPAKVGFDNSWGTSWGDGGRGLITVDDWARLLSMQGDVTQFVPLIEPPPEPVDPEPVPGAKDPRDVRLEADTRDWRKARRSGSNRRAARAVDAWVTARGL